MEHSFSLISVSGYIDPGVISTVMVAVLSALVGVGMVLKNIEPTPVKSIKFVKDKLSSF